eukprot:5047306-Pyramimonas_sp.AAC.1
MFYASASFGAPATILNAARVLMSSGLGGEPMGKKQSLAALASPGRPDSAGHPRPDGQVGH